ncbi:hypothetical protein LTS02_016454 [Friedmanniomyces endolithicus]|nr:hypothetical protein LTS02_016454 [Friedmanniomyces endolithicus]
MPFNKPEDAFDTWKRLSSGRPCDYSGLTYEKLTGGSGIQWPCNEKYPNGKERLFDDGVFFTDVEYCETYGHDLETGTPYSKQDYQKMNPNGRAILKACHYIDSFEVVDQDYPLQLSTGRNVYHFHTRSKTGRSKPLQQAFSEPAVRINEGDAKVLVINNDEEVVVRSRRGAVQMKAKIGRISKGQTFIPFHFGYFDAPDRRARAANELTIELWDPVSKQPCLKAGATPTKDKLAETKPDAHAVGDDNERQRHLELWLGTSYESIRTLGDVFETLVPNLVHDLEVQSGLRVVERINYDTLRVLRPFAERYRTSNEYGHEISRHLRNSLFPAAKTRQNPYEVLITLTGLHVYMANIEAYLTALGPVSQALWDGEFWQAVETAKSNTDRVQKWVRHQLTVRSPQTLVVPSLSLIEEGQRAMD